MGLCSVDGIKETVQTWNELLRTQSDYFPRGNADVFIFLSRLILAGMLDEPLNFDFTEDDPETEGADELHLTSAVHAILVEDL